MRPLPFFPRSSGAPKSSCAITWMEVSERSGPCLTVPVQRKQRLLLQRARQTPWKISNYSCFTATASPTQSTNVQRWIHNRAVFTAGVAWHTQCTTQTVNVLFLHWSWENRSSVLVWYNTHLRKTITRARLKRCRGVRQLDKPLIWKEQYFHNHCPSVLHCQTQIQLLSSKILKTVVTLGESFRPQH